MDKLLYDELLEKLQDFYTLGEYLEAIKLGYEAVKRNRLNLQANYLLAKSLYQQGNILEAYKYYNFLYNLQQKSSRILVSQKTLYDIMDLIIEKIIVMLNNEGECKNIKEIDELLMVNSNEENLLENMFTSNNEQQDYFGMHRFFGKEYYIARYRDWSGVFFTQSYNLNGVRTKSEMYHVDFVGKKYVINAENGFPCICPVVANIGNNSTNEICLKSKTNSAKFLASGNKMYSYLRFNEPCEITGKENMAFTKPVVLKHNQDRKKLILNIFFDSFNWKVIKDNSLKELMPNTYKFFKEGVICNEFFAGSEFTYPSVASYFTGCRSTTHKLLNQNIQFPIPDEFTLLSEVFHDQGYYVSKIGGNDSVLPNYGYIRGVDRFLYQKSEQGFHVEDTIHEVIEHLEAYGEADQFIWAEIQDLHEVAGYWPLSMAVSAGVTADMNEVDNTGGSSLYQTPSMHRREIYKKQLKYIDLQLQMLYEYIKRRYRKNEVIVTLISDHGNGFNVDAEEPFMSEQRTNIPLLLYYDNNSGNICNEKIETIDYGHILCELAKIKDERIINNEGELPMFFGGNKEKDFVFSQSLFPNRHYEATIISTSYKYYFKSEKLVQDDCRIDLIGSSYKLVDNANNEICNIELKNKCYNIVVDKLGDFAINS